MPAMKLSDMYEAYQLKAQLDAIDVSIANVEGGGLQVVIQGIYMDREFADACRSSAVEELQRRRIKIIAKLEELGVSVKE